MAAISNLVLEVSLDSEGQIKAKVDYDVTFSSAEKSANVRYIERALLYERKGLLDDWYWHVGPDPSGEHEAVDSLVQVWQSVGATPDEHPMDNYVVDFGGFDDLNPNASGAEDHRSFTNYLTHWQRNKLLETGREHPYVLVWLVPKQIGAAFELQKLEIDVGDPA